MKKTFMIIVACLLTFTFGISAFALSPTDDELMYLNEYGIFEGDADGDFRFDDAIKRCEAAKMICSAMCMQASEATVPPFPDIHPGNWASGWIDIAKSLKIVNGDENGNFRPEDSVTNEEYLKMLVCALGYEPMAEQKGGFPGGYMSIANRIGLTKDMQFEVNSPAKRGDVAIMTYNALDVPLMCQTGFGSNVEYTIMNGDGNSELRTLRMELDSEWEYPSKEEPADAKSEEGTNTAFDDVYSYEDVEIENISAKNGTYTFSDKRRAGKRTYVVGPDAYIHMSNSTVSIKSAKDGMFARVLCTRQNGDEVKVIGIEVYETNPNVREN